MRGRTSPRFTSLFFPLVFVATVFCGADSNSQSDDVAEMPCEISSDCLAAPDLPTCFRYCRGLECDRKETNTCPVYPRKRRNFVNCVISVPCKKPIEILCVDGRCVGR